MRITKISVKGLFGMFDHEIPLESGVSDYDCAWSEWGGENGNSATRT